MEQFLKLYSILFEVFCKIDIKNSHFNIFSSWLINSNLPDDSISKEELSFLFELKFKISFAFVVNKTQSTQ